MYRSESFCTSGRGTAGSMRTIARSKIAKGGGILTLAHEALTRGADERQGFREEHPHRVAERDRLLVCTAGRLKLGEGRSGQLHGGVQGERRELLALRLLHRLRLLLGELAQASEEILRIAPEREAKSTFHPRKHRDPRPVRVAAWRSGQASSFPRSRLTASGRAWTLRTSSGSRAPIRPPSAPMRCSRRCPTRTRASGSSSRQLRFSWRTAPPPASCSEPAGGCRGDLPPPWP